MIKNYTRQQLGWIENKTNFIKDNIEKLLRLTDILKFINTDMFFKDRLILKGGTAINLTVVDLPRLSVDIDFDYAHNIEREAMQAEKEAIKTRLSDYMWQSGYSLMSKSKEHFALGSFVYNYLNSAGNRDNIKVEINYLDRCHILMPEHRNINTHVTENLFKVLTLDKIELYASKINALLSRSTPRDLYDVYKMIIKNIITDEELLRKSIIFYNAIGGEKDIDNLNFKMIDAINPGHIKRQLKPVISKKDTFDFIAAREIVKEYIKRIINLTDKEKEFITKFRDKEYIPELLFEDNDIITRIEKHPMALWRTREII